MSIERGGKGAFRSPPLQVGTYAAPRPKTVLVHLSDNDLLPDRQSAYRAFRSTETAIARLSSDILTALNAGDIAALALLDLSAAFDMVDNSILLHRLKTSFGLSGI